MGFASAIDSIRHEMERAYYGRKVTDNIDTGNGQEAETNNYNFNFYGSEQQQEAAIEASKEQAGYDPTAENEPQQGQEPESGISPD